MSMGAKAEAFEICAQRVFNGAGLEEALAEYPEWAEEFTPLLETLRAARSVGRQLPIPAESQRHSRAVYLAKANRLAQPAPARASWSSLRFSMAALAILVLLVVTGATVVSTAAQSLPGERFYSLKLLTEKARLRLTSDPAERIHLEQTFDRQRLMEVEALIQQSRSAPVSFVGELTRTQSGDWFVGNVRLLTSSETEFKSEIKPGLFVGVEGALQPDGSVAAAQLWAREYRLDGVLEQRAGDTWVVGGVTVRVSEAIAPPGYIPLGSRVRLQVMEIADGSLAARLVELVALPGILPSTSPVASATSPMLPAITEKGREPGATEKPGEEDGTPEVEETEDEGATGKPEKSEQPSKTPKPSGDEDKTLKVSETPEPDEADETSEPSKTREDDDGDRTPDPTRTRSPSETPKPEETDEPTETPEPEDTQSPSETPEPTDD